MVMAEPVVTAPVVDEWSTDCSFAERSVGNARSQARERLDRWGWPGDVETAVLVVSELTTNAVRHGRAAGHVLLLRLAVLADGGLLVDVSDPVPAFPGFEAREPVGADAEWGRGLAIVRSEVAELSWFLREGIGKTVRARLEASGKYGYADA